MSISFHAHHSPMGAHSSLTCGMFHASGGPGMELEGSADGAVYAGYQDAAGTIHHLPFFAVGEDEKSRYVTDAADDRTAGEQLFSEDEVTRSFRWATDAWSTDRFSFEIITPFFNIPDPAESTPEEQRFACCPVVFARISYDNSQGTDDVRAFFALQGNGRWGPVGSLGNGGIKGLKMADSIGFATFDEVETFVEFGPAEALNRSHKTPNFYLGPAAGIALTAKAGRMAEALVAVAFFKGGQATYGIETKYWYTRYFAGVDDVLGYALANADAYLREARDRDAELAATPLNDEQKFLISHATRSYYGSTEWLDEAGKPRWVVNEGEYRMLNTFDLTVDMLFYEMRFNPWTVRNVLEQFVADYSYYDKVFEPGKPDALYDGGISFCHDMGVFNQFSPRGRSSYEVVGLDRLCFSHMTCEQLVNWVCCAGVYYAQTEDMEFLVRHRGILADCLSSMQNRDNPDPQKRNGIMSFESSRTLPGGEITTYDSLDHSLGQARNNIYLAVKSWAAYLALEHLFAALDMPDEGRAAAATAGLCADTLVAAYNDKLGYIPAVLEGDNKSAIIPAIEGLVFPKEMKLAWALDFNGRYGELLKTLDKHLRNILVKGVCIYEDNGWKLSSTADNSWMSKICLCQHVARTVFGIDDDASSDHAHAEWERNGSTFHACSDQFHSGIAKGSLYYPRIVTNILWMAE